MALDDSESEEEEEYEDAQEVVEKEEEEEGSGMESDLEARREEGELTISDLKCLHGKMNLCERHTTHFAVFTRSTE